jgi:hypothetical protein
MAIRHLTKIVGGLCILGATYFLGYSKGSNNVFVDDNISEYLTKIEQSLPDDVNLKGDTKVINNQKGRVVLHIDDRVSIRLYDRPKNGIYDSNVDVVEIIGKDNEIYRVYQSIESHPPAEYIRPFTLEDQIAWNAIYGSIVDKDSELPYG